VIYVVTTADAHEELARQLAPLLEPGQCVVLNPGRTGGALAMRVILNDHERARQAIVAEAQSLVFACRADHARVRVIGVKAFVPVAACPGRDTPAALRLIRPHFSCFHPADSVLHTGFENIGAMFHPAIVIFNAATIERGQPFYFYQDMTPAIAEFLVALDDERLAAAHAYGLRSHSIFEWVKLAYPSTVGDTLCDRLRNNPAYNEVLAPARLESRLLTEDVPTGLVPLSSLGAAAGVSMPLTTAIIDLAGRLLNRDFRQEGRTIERMGLAGLTPQQIQHKLFWWATDVSSATQ
jgi:opine dehydrogenase